jgi:hypothetical protein
MTKNPGLPEFSAEGPGFVKQGNTEQQESAGLLRSKIAGQQKVLLFHFRFIETQKTKSPLHWKFIPNTIPQTNLPCALGGERFALHGIAHQKE